MARGMRVIAAVSVGLLFVFTVWYLCFPSGWVLSAAITFGTVAYHFCMRLVVGMLIDRRMQNRADGTKPWFRMRTWERQLYARLGVKHWKRWLPTYDADAFSPKCHTWEEIVGAMCQAEIVHEIIIPLSFLPMFAVPWFGAFPVFFCTSILAALFDLQFVILQRYNRPRVLRFIEKTNRSNRT